MAPYAPFEMIVWNYKENVSVSEETVTSKEAGPSRDKRDENEVQKLVNVFQEHILIPFVADDHRFDLL